MTSGGRALGGALLIGATVVAVDQVTKRWAVRAVADGPIDLFWTLRIKVTENTGMAFSQARGWGPVIGLAAMAVVGVLLVVVRRTPERLNWVGVGLIAGGAVGNLIDRLTRSPGWLRGGVVDFIDLQWFPIFNVADIAINVGAAVVIITALFGSTRPEVSDDVDIGER